MLGSGSARADALIDNVRGETLDKQGEVVHFTGMLIDRQGRIVKLLHEGDERPQILDWRTDMHGRIVIPGMIDAHGHVMELGFRDLSLDLSDTGSLAEAQAKIARFAKEHPDRPWILGGGWNQERWGLGRFPTAAELDKTVSDRPVWLMRADGHAGWANSRALAAAGVTAKTKAPSGGRIETGAGGVPAGVFVDAATNLIEKAVPKPSPLDYDAAFLQAQKHLLSDGITATADMGTTLEDWMAYRRAGDRGALRIRIMSYAHGVDTATLIAGPRPTPWLYQDRLKAGGIKLYADGALGSRGAWLKQPYADASGETGIQLLSDDQLLNLMSRGAMDDFQIAVHAIGDRANQQVLDAIDVLSETYDGDRRWRIEHAQIVDPADLPKFKRHGIIASMQPTHATSDMNMAEARLGEARLKGAYAWRTMLDMGVPLAFGSDYPVEDPDPFVGWAVAFTRQNAAGEPAGGWRPQEKVSRIEAWRAFTLGAAYAGFAEEEFGTLAPGLKADFLIVDRDPLEATPKELRNTKVLETWIGGQRVWKRD
ncbi:amidohydrolase [Stakelama saccharophila]|uniref:Amidohydrolase n=1 Tax=Stakelama saccharophila TaxID=3075605 RepID=A0ABZ0BCG7_9SPHN|nr:amidohydrolase [Stakelama sp. W311]WNO55130.1 amidohydrolase [Stakelama sp. W311]